MNFINEEFNLLIEKEIHSFLVDVIIITLLLSLTYLLSRLSKVIIDRVIVDKHISHRLQQFIPKVIWLFGVIFAISQIAKSIEILVLVVGLMGIGLVIGLRDVLASILVRPFLDLYFPNRVGDWISIGGLFGKVIEINPMNTILLSEDEEVVVIPNYLFAREIFINKSEHAKYEVSLPIILENDIDVIEFENELLKLCNSMSRYIKKHPKPVVATTDIEDKAEELTLIFTLKSPEEKGIVVSKLNEEIKKIMDELRENRKNK